MAKLVLFSDLHSHNFKAYSSLLPNGLSNRLQDSFEVIDKVLEVASKVEADLVLFGGDLFHVRKQVPTIVFNGIYERIAKFYHKVPVVMIHGNHDQADRDGEHHSLYALQELATIVDKPGWLTVKGKSGNPYNILAVPYIEDSQKLMETINQPNNEVVGAPRLFLGHFGMNGARVGADYVYSSPNDPSIKDLHPERFDAGFLGHFHEYQALGSNFYYIGSPLATTWGEKNQVKGCLVYDTDTKVHERVNFNFSGFIEVNEEDLGLVGNYRDHYLRVISNRQWSLNEKEGFKATYKPRSLEIIPVRVPISTEEGPRINVQPGMSFSEMLVNYTNSGLVSLEGLDEDYLTQIGQEILNEVQE